MNGCRKKLESGDIFLATIKQQDLIYTRQLTPYVGRYNQKDNKGQHKRGRPKASRRLDNIQLGLD